MRGTPPNERAVATDGSPDLVEAARILARFAFIDGGPQPGVVDVTHGNPQALTVLMGREAAVALIPREANASDAATLSMMHGGFGVSLFWAEQVLRRHRVQSWQLASMPEAIGLTFPLVCA